LEVRQRWALANQNVPELSLNHQYVKCHLKNSLCVSGRHEIPNCLIILMTLFIILQGLESLPRLPGGQNGGHIQDDSS
jgi:hypothetical protein